MSGLLASSRVWLRLHFFPLVALVFSSSTSSFDWTIASFLFTVIGQM